MRSLISSSSASVLLAGGTGSRFSASRPKQFVSLASRDVLDHSIQRLVKITKHVCIVVHPEWMDYVRSKYQSLSNVVFATGGETRQLSVWSGLQALSAFSPQLVCIHDGARPLCSSELFQASLVSAQDKGSGVAAVSAHETLARVDGDRLIEFPDRSELVHIQTPQSFTFSAIYNAHSDAIRQGKVDYTDDSQVFLAAGHEVFWVKGESTNLKITQALDISLAQFILEQGP